MNEPKESRRYKIPALVWVLTFSLCVTIALTYFAVTTITEGRRAVRRAELFAGGLRYHVFYDIHRRPPRNLDEFMNLRPGILHRYGDDNYLDGYCDKVRRRKIIVLWGATFLDIPHGNDTHLLAYESQTPEAGGFVLMIGGSAKLVTPEEFAQIPGAPQAKTY